MVTLNDFDQITTGARFLEADLHVHSYGGSHDVRDATMTPAAIVDAAVGAGVSVLALTDHNSTANTRASIGYAQQAHPGAILVLAGVEITTAHGHLLVYFAPDAVSKLETFVARLDVVGAGTGDSHTTMSMADVIAEAVSRGGLCVAAHIDRKTGFEGSAAAFPNWKKDIVASPGLVGIELADAANLAWYSSDDGTAEAAARARLLGERDGRAGRRSPLARVQNSDAHTLADFVGARAKRSLTRIKMTDLSFDGFRTAFADPEARVRATATLAPTVPRLVAMHVAGGFLREEKYKFSENLTCFIGGRGTGKSTALRCIAHALGVDETLDGFDNCPDSVVVYARDAAGVLYRYERMRGSSPVVKAKDDGGITNVPISAFPIEFYGQGHLAEVARDPLANAQRFQEFLDRNTHLADLFEKEAELVAELESNGTRLRPLEVQAASRSKKQTELEAVNVKLRLAEEGKLKELVARQTQLGAEKTLARGYGDVRDFYAKGISLAGLERDGAKIEDAAGSRAGDPTVEVRVGNLKSLVDTTNAFLRQQQQAITTKMRESAARIGEELEALSLLYAARDAEVAAEVGAFQKQGLSASVADLQRHVTRQGQLATEIGRIDQAGSELEVLRAARASLQDALGKVREEITSRRKELVRKVNQHLRTVIDGYTVAIKLEPEGIADRFIAFVVEQMRGTWFQEEAARRLCTTLTPQRLAELVKAADADGLVAVGGVNADGAAKLCERLGALERVHQLETIWKTPRPTILVVPSGAGGAKPIPINQLSDGQRHTIFLTIAMLGDSEIPLIIDQPEDDLDNAFIFSSVVATLRRVKERRQVVVVTHNANIAVLGDAELIFPMHRTDDRGTAVDRGAVDRKATRDEVQRILEGGEEAFRRRKEIYGV